MVSSATLSSKYVRYVPVVPMILINGASGIGTGWSSNIPNFNPRDVVENIRRLMNDEDPEPMQPWYRGFRGDIEKKKGVKSYTVRPYFIGSDIPDSWCVQSIG
jgi:DNA gyrase/topoisomerase IV subunit A